MGKKSLSDLLREWRADRPDEWKMDEFIRAAEKLEDAMQEFIEERNEAMKCGWEWPKCDRIVYVYKKFKNLLNQS